MTKVSIKQENNQKFINKTLINNTTNATTLKFERRVKTTLWEAGKSLKRSLKKSVKRWSDWIKPQMKTKEIKNVLKLFKDFWFFANKFKSKL